MLEKELQITADLANIALAPEEFKRLEQEVTAMVNYFGKMQELDVSELESVSQVQGSTRARPDGKSIDIPDGNMADAILELSPDLEDRFVCIPNVL
jgi:aspartyl-tRNA(Asn)/glutamyl-tRNA(Gln) amidotransferase subunit C